MRSNASDDAMGIEETTDDEMPLEMPTLGDLLRTVYGLGAALIMVGIVIAPIAVLALPFTRGFLDPASIALDFVGWFVALGVFMVLISNGLEWGRQSYRVEPIDSEEVDEVGG